MKLVGTINGDNEQSRFGKSVLDNKFVEKQEEKLQMEKEQEETKPKVSMLSILNSHFHFL